MKNPSHQELLSELNLKQTTPVHGNESFSSSFLLPLSFWSFLRYLLWSLAPLQRPMTSPYHDPLRTFAARAPSQKSMTSPSHDPLQTRSKICIS